MIMLFIAGLMKPVSTKSMHIDTRCGVHLIKDGTQVALMGRQQSAATKPTRTLALQ